MDDSPSAAKVLSAAVVFEGALGLVAVGAGWLGGHPLGPLVHWNPWAAALGCVGSLPLVAVLVFAQRSTWGPLARLNQIVNGSIVPLFARCSWLDLALISLLAGMCEELLFRGLVQAAVGRWVSPAAGLIVGGILFGLAHAISVGYAVMATAFGLYLGALWIATDNLLVPIVAHAVYDLLALAYLLARRPTA